MNAQLAATEEAIRFADKCARSHWGHGLIWLLALHEKNAQALEARYVLERVLRVEGTRN